MPYFSLKDHCGFPNMACNRQQGTKLHWLIHFSLLFNRYWTRWPLICIKERASWTPVFFFFHTWQKIRGSFLGLLFEPRNSSEAESQAFNILDKDSEAPNAYMQLHSNLVPKRQKIHFLNLSSLCTTTCRSQISNDHHLQKLISCAPEIISIMDPVKVVIPKPSQTLSIQSGKTVAVYRHHSKPLSASQQTICSSVDSK